MQFKIGMVWNNEAGHAAAAIRWSQASWRRYLPVPLREGGFAIRYGGVLCLPQEPRSTVFYTFQIPEHFPVGRYFVNYYPLQADRWRDASTGYSSFPFTIHVESREPSQSDRSWLYRQLYPFDHKLEPIVWSLHRLYRNVRLEGYRTSESHDHLFSCPGSPPGIYELSIRGEGTPVTNPEDADDLWPAVQIFLPGDKNRPVATVRIADEKTGVFSAEFTAFESFDTLLLRMQAGRGRGGDLPLWMNDFLPTDYGKQVLSLREARLKLKSPLFAQVAESTPPPLDTQAE